MNIKEFIKKYYKISILIAIISLVLTVVLRGKLEGIKDAVMFFLATAVLCFEMYYAFIDKKKSLLLFIASFAIIVTGRKACNFDFLFFRVTYESIYITFIFLFSFKQVMNSISKYLKGKKTPEFHFIMLTAVFVLFSLNSCIYSKNIFSSLSYTYINIFVPVMFMLSILGNFKKEDIKNLIYALIIGIDLSCLYGFVQVTSNGMSLAKIRTNREMLTFGYHNINIFAGILVLIMPLVVDMILYNFKSKTKNEKIFLGVSMFLNLAALYLTMTRGAWIAFLVSAFIILVSKKYIKLLYGLLVVFLIGSKWIFKYILYRGQMHNDFFQNESMTARLQSIFTSIRILMKYPFGTGGGVFADFYKEFVLKGYMLFPSAVKDKITVATYALESAHNLWMQIAVDFGIVTLLAFLVIVINRVISIVRNYSLNRGNFTAIIVYLIFSILTGAEFEHKGIITGTLIIWLIFAFIQLNGEEGYSNEAID